MLFDRQGERATDGTGKINHADVFVSGMNAVDIEDSGSNEGPGTSFGGWRSLAEKLDFQTALLTGLPQGCLLWVLV